MGTIREQDTLDRIVQLELPVQKISVRNLQAFRLAAHLMLSLGDKSAAIETRRTLRSLVSSEHAPDLELLLGSLQQPDLSRLSQGEDELVRVGLNTHHPVWWVEYCFRLFGRGQAIELLSSPSRPRYIRVNPLRNRGKYSLPIHAKAMSNMLRQVSLKHGIYSLQGPLSTFSQFFAQGLFQIQDLASFLAIKAADPKPGERVLDLCAAPGAKTTTLAQLMRNRGQIISVDYSRSRMETWKRETARLGVKIGEPLIGDVNDLGVHEEFDLVVIDPPCTGTGVFDRNPSMKWHLSPESLRKYTILQRRFLNSASRLVKENGRILYCTCSVTLEENEAMISSFLKTHPEFETRPIIKEYGSPGLHGLSDCRRFYPNRDGTAGYVVSLMQRMA